MKFQVHSSSLHKLDMLAHVYESQQAAGQEGIFETLPQNKNQKFHDNLKVKYASLVKTKVSWDY